jgi:hypothetical protein
MHGTSGTYNIEIGAASPSGVECRAAGTNGAYQLIATFANPTTLEGVTVTSRDGLATATQTVTSGVVTINLSGVANAQTLGVTLRGVSEGPNLGDVAIPFRVLVGDTTNNGSVTASDIGQVKGQSGPAGERDELPCRRHRQRRQHQRVGYRAGESAIWHPAAVTQSRRELCASPRPRPRDDTSELL